MQNPETSYVAGQMAEIERLKAELDARRLKKAQESKPQNPYTYEDLKPVDRGTSLKVMAFVHLVGNDVEQLKNDVEELRALLAPISAQREQQPTGQPQEPMVAQCEVSAELRGIYQNIQHLRATIYHMVAGLDL